MGSDLSKVGTGGAVIIPAERRRRFGIEEGALVVTEAREDGVLIRPATATPLDEERRPFLAELDQAYAALREDPVLWAEELAERRALEGTLMDGLDPDEIWTEDGDVLAQPDDARGDE